jgi:hypothetical protein
MALKATVDSLEAVPEAVRGEYEAKDGKFVLKIEGAEDVSGLRKNRDDILTEKQRVAAELDKYKAMGLAPEKIKELADAAQKAEEERQKAEGNWDTLKNTLNEQHKGQLAEKDKAIGGLTSQVEELMVDNVATQAITAEKGDAKLLLPHIKAHTKVVQESGKFVTKVVDEKGNVRIANDGSGNPMTIAQLVVEMKADQSFGRAFDGSGATGSGAPNKGNSGSGAGSVKSVADLKTIKAKSDFIDQFGLDAFKALPAK